MELASLKLSEISESPTNPRKDFDKASLAELAGDIELHGVLQPILVRKVDKGFEIVFGHRRFRAAKIAGLKEIPAMVREMSDLEVLEAQLVENLKRTDLHPLELAGGYKDLLEKHGVTIEQLCEKVGKSRASVYATLKLNDLAAPGRKAFHEGKLNASTALLVARVPGQLQAAVLEKAVNGRHANAGPMSYRDLQELVQREYMLDLKCAPFDQTDATLLAAAGACPACPKRTGAQPELFATDKVHNDVCTDPTCWREKVQKHAAQIAETRGIPLLPKKEKEEIFSQWGDLQTNKYVSAEASNHDDGKSRKYGQLLTEKEKKKVAVLAVDPKGNLVELYKTDGLKEALKEAGKISKEKPSSPHATWEKKNREARKKEKAAEALRSKYEPVVMAAMVAAVEKKGFDKKLLLLLARLIVLNGEGVLERRGVKLQGYAWQLTQGQFDKHFGKFSLEQLQGLVFECIISEGRGLARAEAARLLGVDAKKIEKDVLAKDAAAAKAPKVDEMGMSPADVTRLKKDLAKKAPKPVKKKAA